MNNNFPDGVTQKQLDRFYGFDKEPRIVFYCEDCAEPILLHDDYYSVDGKPMCKQCCSIVYASEDIKCDCCGKEIEKDDLCYEIGDYLYCDECVTELTAD